MIKKIAKLKLNWSTKLVKIIQNAVEHQLWKVTGSKEPVWEGDITVEDIEDSKCTEVSYKGDTILILEYWHNKGSGMSEIQIFMPGNLKPQHVKACETSCGATEEHF